MERRADRSHRPKDDSPEVQGVSIRKLREDVRTNRFVIACLLFGGFINGYYDRKNQKGDLAERLKMNLRDEGDSDSRIEFGKFLKRLSLTFEGEEYDDILEIWSPSEGRLIHKLRTGYADNCMEIIVDGNPATEIKPERCYK